jgi:hypothetical protein
MRTVIIALFITVHMSLATPGFCQEQKQSTPLSSALKFFHAFAYADLDSLFRALRTVPLSAQAREVVHATLPPEGELTPTPDEVRKLAAMKPVLVYHERDQVFDIKVIDLPQAFIGLHARAILLISRPALKVLTPSELKALTAHEIGHDFLWNEFERGRHGRARQQLELECDGIASLTLSALGLDPMRLLAATKKLEQFNEQFGTPLNAADYPTRQDRERFINTLLHSRQ